MSNSMLSCTTNLSASANDFHNDLNDIDFGFEDADEPRCAWRQERRLRTDWSLSRPPNARIHERCAFAAVGPHQRLRRTAGLLKH